MLQLGKYYLELAEEKDKETNNRTAVEWFLKAAKQGRRDAAKQLQKCWIQNKGEGKLRKQLTLRTCLQMQVMSI